MQPGEGVHGVRADGGVSDGPFGDGGEGRVGPGADHGFAAVWVGDVFLEGVEGVGGAEVVLGEEDRGGLAVLEPDHRVLPVPDVVAEADVEDFNTFK